MSVVSWETAVASHQAYWAGSRNAAREPLTDEDISLITGEAAWSGDYAPPRATRRAVLGEWLPLLDLPGIDTTLAGRERRETRETREERLRARGRKRAAARWAS